MFVHGPTRGRFVKGLADLSYLDRVVTEPGGRLNHQGHHFEITGAQLFATKSLPDHLRDLFRNGGKARFYKISKKTCICLVKDDNGFETIGIAQIDSENFDDHKMRVWALKDAFEQIEDEQSVDDAVRSGTVEALESLQAGKKPSCENCGGCGIEDFRACDAGANLENCPDCNGTGFAIKVAA